MSTQFKLFPSILPVFLNTLNSLSFYPLLSFPFSPRSHSLHSYSPLHSRLETVRSNLYPRSIELRRIALSSNAAGLCRKVSLYDLLSFVLLTSPSSSSSPGYYPWESSLTVLFLCCLDHHLLIHISLAVLTFRRCGEL